MNTPPVDLKLTPMLEQYQKIKEHHPGCLLFFRLGDFYELFFEDAIKAAAALDITLTRRGKTEGGDIPMCGVPFHASDAYVARLIRQGFKVAICEQLEDPIEAKKRGHKAVVKRDVVRIITPGTLTEDTLLAAKQHNFLISIAECRGVLGVGAIDISTGDFFLEPSDLKTLPAVLARFEPTEILISQKLSHIPQLFELLQEWKRFLTLQPDSRFDHENGKHRLESTFKVSTLESFGQFSAVEIMAGGAILEYVNLTQKGKIPHLKAPKTTLPQDYLQIDAATRRNLELVWTLNGERRGSLLETIDKTVTSAGGRLLISRLSAPLKNSTEIQKRLDMVEWFLPQDRFFLQSLLKATPDLERTLSRLSLERGGPRDLASVKETLSVAEEFLKFFSSYSTLPSKLLETLKSLKSLPPLKERLARALHSHLPLLARDGDFIAQGYSQDLDHLRVLRDEGKQTIAALQARYIQETGVNILKIKHNNVLGYYIEITSAHKSRLPEDIFIHRQTLVNNMRYTTVELSELEQNLMSAGEKGLALELAFFEDLRQEVLAHTGDLLQTTAALAELDLAISLADLASSYHYSRPVLDDSLTLEIIGGRHPVVEKALKENNKEAFVDNDCHLTPEERLWLLTGPNMAGKSTFLRQNALIIILAQMGSFVPAQKAHIGIVDRVFSRVGAADDLARGQSTFMVEMVETASILNQATERSFVILDEIGRGTATFDGLSLAWSVLEYLHEINKCRTLFATHYHELTDLQKSLKSLACYTMQIKEWEEDVIFLHKVSKGCANRSYGIHVAKLAGLPSPVIQRAEFVLKHLEEGDFFELKSKSKVSLSELPLFENVPSLSQQPSPLIAEVTNLNPDLLSPREALEAIYHLKTLLQKAL
jgi:DNA mismatch repair protein MutS